MTTEHPQSTPLYSHSQFTFQFHMLYTSTIHSNCHLTRRNQLHIVSFAHIQPLSKLYETYYFFATDLRTKLKLVKAGYNVLNYVGCVTWLLWLLLLDERRPDINWTRKCPNFISSLCVYQLVRILVNMMEKKQSSGLILALCLAVCMGFAASEILKSDPLTRLIPADVLRGDDTFNWFI